jgi:hypothetical protein
MAALTTEQISIIVEASLIFLIAVFLILILIKYRKGKSKLKLNVFWIFLFILLAFLGVLGSRLTYYPLNVESYPNDIMRWVLLRLGWYRFSFAFILISTYFSYLLKEAIFDTQRKKGRYFIILFICVAGSIFSIVTPSSENDTIYYLSIFLVVFLYVFIVYIEFIIKSISLYKHIEKTDTTYRTAILSLVIMAFCFIIAILMFVSDFVYKYLTDIEDYTVFYYLADVSILVGIISAYFGYVRPKA